MNCFFQKLYLKNLPRDTTKEDLASIFVRYETMNMPCMEYRVLEGRMRGQAFITFPGISTPPMTCANPAQDSCKSLYSLKNVLEFEVVLQRHLKLLENENSSLRIDHHP